MRKLPCDGAGDEIARDVVLFVFRHLHGDPASLEIGLKVGHSAVVNISIRPLEAPDFRIFGEVLFHVLMDELLEIKALDSQCSDYDIGADSFFLRNVTAGIAH